MRAGERRLVGRMVWALALAGVAVLACAAVALAHVERTSYWPDPKPDTSVSPPAGGAVPKARSLASALKSKPPGKTRVVCQKGSLKKAKRDIGAARKTGVSYRPTQARKKLTKKQAKRLLKLNRKFKKRCKFSEIQAAVTASGNNDRVVIMPGIYTEETSRAVPNLPPECDQYRTDNSDHGSGAVTYDYQFHCPNAQNLVAVIGRGADTGPLPESGPSGRPDPHGIPSEGPCIRCNVQIEGSGPGPDSVVLDSGNVASGNGAPIDPKKDVTVTADRADGFVLKNVTTRHAAEHDVYVLETDGYLLKDDKFFYAGEYGTLTFTSDHGVTHTCDAAGNGDSGVYPGGAPDSNKSQRDPSFYPEDRLNQLITKCDSHHNNLGYSGTMGNATHVLDNNFYDNTTGIATDSFYAGGHPGYPQNGAVYENNRIYSNNFNVYAPDSDVKSAVPVPIGVGMLIGGGNEDTLKGNHIYDNWRRGTMLISVPDAISCAPDSNGAVPCVPEGAATTSVDNMYTGNTMGRAPDGTQMPNGVDFWWDEFASNTGNCWPDNKGIDNTPASITSDPPRAPGDETLPGFLAVKDCDSPNNVGVGDAQKEHVLAACAADFQQGSYDATVCDWFTPPEKPTAGGGNGAPPNGVVLSPGVRAATFPSLCNLVGGLGGTLTCSPFQHRLS
jgi:hypothetical protein